MGTSQAKKSNAGVKLTFNNLFPSCFREHSVTSLKKRHIFHNPENELTDALNICFSKPLPTSKARRLKGRTSL
jgi:hypothetical protein